MVKYYCVMLEIYEDYIVVILAHFLGGDIKNVLSDPCVTIHVEFYGKFTETSEKDPVGVWSMCVSDYFPRMKSFTTRLTKRRDRRNTMKKTKDWSRRYFSKTRGYLYTFFRKAVSEKLWSWAENCGFWIGCPYAENIVYLRKEEYFGCSTSPSIYWNFSPIAVIRLKWDRGDYEKRKKMRTPSKEILMPLPVLSLTETARWECRYPSPIYEESSIFDVAIVLRYI